MTLVRIVFISFPYFPPPKFCFVVMFQIDDAAINLLVSGEHCSKIGTSVFLFIAQYGSLY